MSWELLVSVAVFGLLLYLLGKYHGEAEVMEDYCATLEEELDKAQKSIGWLHSRREMESKEMLDRIADMKKAGFEGGKAAPEPDPPKPPLGNAIEQLLEAITDPVYRDDVRSECYARGWTVPCSTRRLGPRIAAQSASTRRGASSRAT